MSANGKPDCPVDLWTYHQNRLRMPWDRLEPFRGKWVAISGDGTTVLAAGGDLTEAEASLARLGIPGNSVGWEYIPGPDEDNML